GGGGSNSAHTQRLVTGLLVGDGLGIAWTARTAEAVTARPDGGGGHDRAGLRGERLVTLFACVRIVGVNVNVNVNVGIRVGVSVSVSIRISIRVGVSVGIRVGV